MNKTAIEWCDYTWNPVTGCLHTCPYCYARSIAHRFSANGSERKESIERDGQVVVLDTPFITNGGRGMVSPYPFGFAPTFHRYRLGEPAAMKKGQRIFVGSMADLFGEWVPSEWIDDVILSCVKAPQHKYLFLTKNPQRYNNLVARAILPKYENFWYGTTINKQEDVRDIALLPWPPLSGRFISIEPMMERINLMDISNDVDWVIVGAESGNRKGRVAPDREWLVGLRHQCWQLGIPLFMKDSLASIWGEPLPQEFPEGVKL
jgi:protein gp37